jgi:arginase (EC 3.5.3.1)
MRRPVRILGVPMDLGQGRRGVDMGPSAVRYAGLQARLEGLGYQVEDGGNIIVPVPEEVRAVGPGGMRHLEAVAETCERVFQAVRETVADGRFPIILGGDHSIAMGTIAGIIAAAGPTGVLWIDAHGDFNTPKTSPSGNIHGMPLAHLVGRGHPRLIRIGGPEPKLRPEQVVLIGVRSLDPEERRAMAESGMLIFTMREIDELGIATVVRQALTRLKAWPRLHVSLDLDVLDPQVAPGVGTPVPGGLTYREAHLMMEILADSGRVGSVDVVEINPILDERNRTAELAVELLASLLGQQIL